MPVDFIGLIATQDGSESPPGRTACRRLKFDLVL